MNKMILPVAAVLMAAEALAGRNSRRKILIGKISSCNVRQNMI